MSFSIIAAVGRNRELGKNGKLLFRLPNDLKFFKKTTMGHPILMGRKTFESLPGILPGRKHYVISRSMSEKEGVVVINDLSTFIDNNKDTTEEIFVIGGGMIYWELIKFANKIYLTEVDAEDKDADTFFPEFNKENYKKTILGRGIDHGIKYTFTLYEKLK
ncbi:dihydrofolate reductase [Candidatus Saccharibacteria bacterium]|nr:dihydrofolate reductase [Candidatus Saccharibacteria bacterium]